MRLTAAGWAAGAPSAATRLAARLEAAVAGGSDARLRALAARRPAKGGATKPSCAWAAAPR